jgi:hypothetical protein
MIARVESHNRLNGFAFVIGEFALIGGVAGVFAAIYLARGNIAYTSICAGICVNSLVVIVLAARAIARREMGVGIFRIYTQPALRAQVVREHPDLSKDTLLITVSVLVPFLLFLMVALEGVGRW